MTVAVTRNEQIVVSADLYDQQPVGGPQILDRNDPFTNTTPWSTFVTVAASTPSQAVTLPFPVQGNFLRLEGLSGCTFTWKLHNGDTANTAAPPNTGSTGTPLNAVQTLDTVYTTLYLGNAGGSAIVVRIDGAGT